MIATVGHVLGDTCDSISVQISADGRKKSLRTIKDCKGFVGRPRFRLGWPEDRPCLNEICLIETIGLESAQTKCRFPLDLDCHALVPPIEETDQEFTATDPKLADPDEMIAWVEQNRPVTVYKHGAATGHTTGNLMRIKELEQGFHQGRPLRRSPSSSQSSDSDCEKDSTRTFHLVVEWLSPAQPFAAPGDSGSLVYAKRDNVIVPFGIHYGSKGCVSYAYLLWFWCEEVSCWLKADLHFCDPGECPASAMCK